MLFVSLLIVLLLALTSNATKFAVSQTPSEEHGFSFRLVLDPKSDIMRITMTGPSNRYFALGFGDSVMENTYAIVARTEVMERFLDEHESGELLLPTFNVISNTVKGPVRTVELKKKLSSIHHIERYFDFNVNTKTGIKIGEKIPIIWAVGKTEKWEKHAFYGIGNVILKEQSQNLVDDDVINAKKIDSNGVHGKGYHDNAVPDQHPNYADIKHRLEDNNDDQQEQVSNDEPPLTMDQEALPNNNNNNNNINPMKIDSNGAHGPVYHGHAVPQQHDNHNDIPHPINPMKIDSNGAHGPAYHGHAVPEQHPNHADIKYRYEENNDLQPMKIDSNGVHGKGYHDNAVPEQHPNHADIKHRYEDVENNDIEPMKIDSNGAHGKGYHDNAVPEQHPNHADIQHRYEDVENNDIEPMKVDSNGAHGKAYHDNAVPEQHPNHADIQRRYEEENNDNNDNNDDIQPMKVDSNGAHGPVYHRHAVPEQHENHNDIPHPINPKTYYMERNNNNVDQSSDVPYYGFILVAIIFMVALYYSYKKCYLEKRDEKLLQSFDESDSAPLIRNYGAQDHYSVV